MNIIHRIPILGRLIQEDKGQALVFTAMILTAFLGVTGLTVDAGKGYYCFELLQASTNAAALAGAAGMPNTTTATTYAKAYGSKTGAFNANGMLSNVVTNVTFGCSATVTNDFSAPCENSAGQGVGLIYNTIQVSQTGATSTWIGALFGIPTFNLQDTATASAKGGTPTPYNIAIVLDTTASMQGSDDGANNGPGSTPCSTQIACAEAGIVTFLKMLVPGSTASPIDDVSLFTFPAFTTATVSADTDCSGTSNPTIVPYTFADLVPGAAFATGLPVGDTYTVYNNGNNYKTTNSTSTLNSLSNIVKAVGGASGCSGMGAPGGEGTYYAQVIYAAQQHLVTQASADGYANMMIILSDGDATACNTALATSGGTTTTNTCSGSSQITAATGTLSGTGTSTSNPMKPTGCTPGGTTTCTGYHSYNYPSALGECGQAVVAAQAASAAGTQVYTIGYASETSGCTTDATYSATVSDASYGANNWSPGSSPCSALGAMATASNYFFTDNVHNCAATDPANTDITTLNGIFSRIGSNISGARLIPNANLNA